MALNSPRTIFITGASSGIGAATALEAAQRGYQVVGAGSRAIEEIPQTLQCLPRDQFIYVKADLTNADQIPLVRQQGVANFANLGTVYGFLNAGAFEKDSGDPERVTRMLLTNTWGAVGMAYSLRDLVGGEGGLLASSSIVSAENLNIVDAAKYRWTKDFIANFILTMHENPEHQGAFQGIRGGVVYIGASPTGMTTREGELIMGMLMSGALSSQADPEIRARLYATLSAQGNPAAEQNVEAFLRAFLGEDGFAQMGADRAGKLALTLLKKDVELSNGRTRLPFAKYFVSPGEVQQRVNQLLVRNDIAVASETVGVQVMNWVDEGLPLAGSPGTRRAYGINGADGPVQGLLKTFSN